MNTVAIGTQVLITLERHCFQGDIGTITAVEKSGINRHAYTVKFQGFGCVNYRRDEFVIFEEAPETLCAEYDSWLDSLSPDYYRPFQGWTPEDIEEAQRKEAALWAGIAALQDGQPSRAEQAWEREKAARLARGINHDNPITFNALLREW
jgi:hypothetical protein